MRYRNIAAEKSQHKYKQEIDDYLTCTNLWISILGQAAITHIKISRLREKNFWKLHSLSLINICEDLQWTIIKTKAKKTFLAAEMLPNSVLWFMVKEKALKASTDLTALINFSASPLYSHAKMLECYQRYAQIWKYGSAD